MLSRNLYYNIRPLIPRFLQIAIRRRNVSNKLLSCSDIWPIDEKAGCTPDLFPGWPEQKRFALILTHDVETAQGQEKCHNLIKLEEELGFRSSFSFVPKRYAVSSELRHYLSSNGFEVALHGLYHDGKLYKSEKEFKQRALEIDNYLQEWNAVGFRSPSMHKNLDWIHNLNIEYDASTFDTDPFEPCSKGVGTIFPFWVSQDSSDSGYVELPYTLPQDFTLFVLMKEKNIDVWKRKLDWIAEKGGMALIVTHPDYMNFCSGTQSIEEYPAKLYKDFLTYAKEQYNGQYWHPLPKDLASLFKKTKPTRNDVRVAVSSGSLAISPKAI